jgi:hypothetical protein
VVVTVCVRNNMQPPTLDDFESFGKERGHIKDACGDLPVQLVIDYLDSCRLKTTVARPKGDVPRGVVRLDLTTMKQDTSRHHLACVPFRKKDQKPADFYVYPVDFADDVELATSTAYAGGKKGKQSR